MKRRGLVLMSMLFLARAACGSEPSVDERFAAAGKAYNENRLAEAAAAYEEMRREGYLAPELFYNLGNAYFRLGQMGHAIVNYRRAWYFSPRDPDLCANLRFALDTAGALNPTYSLPQRISFLLSERQWRQIGSAAWWISAALGCGWLLWRARPASLWRLAATGLGLALVSLGATVQWQRMARAPEVVVFEKNQQTYFAPLDGATPHFAVPEGSILRVVDRSGEWLKVSRGRQEGWMPSVVCVPVCNWLASTAGYATE